MSEALELVFVVAGGILGWYLRGKVKPNRGAAAFDAVKKANDERKTRPEP